MNSFPSQNITLYLDSFITSLTTLLGASNTQLSILEECQEHPYRLNKNMLRDALMIVKKFLENLPFIEEESAHVRSLPLTESHRAKCNEIDRMIAQIHRNNEQIIFLIDHFKDIAPENDIDPEDAVP